MKSPKFLSLALVLIVAGVAYGATSHSRDSVGETDSNMLNVQSSFKLSMPLFMRNAIDALTSTSAPPCQITSCLNGGTLNASSVGSCPTCVCPPGCNGTKCETCSSVSTTTAVGTTTKYNCATLTCMNGFSPIYDNFGNCWCNCSGYYQGEFCELENKCKSSHLKYCQNGGTAYYLGGMYGGCGCKCPSCYYGSNCESFNLFCGSSTASYTTYTDCNSFGCLNGMMNYTGASCKCSCSQGYSGDTCELYNTCSNQVSCYNGGSPKYNYANRTCTCGCPPGFYGSNCLNTY